MCRIKGGLNFFYYICKLIYTRISQYCKKEYEHAIWIRLVQLSDLFIIIVERRNSLVCIFHNLQPAIVLCVYPSISISLTC